MMCGENKGSHTCKLGSSIASAEGPAPIGPPRGIALALALALGWLLAGPPGWPQTAAGGMACGQTPPSVHLP